MFFPAFGQKKEKDKALAGKVFTVEFTQVGGKKASDPVADEISFKSEKLNSKFMTTENQFLPTPYTATVDSSDSYMTITFEASGKNQADEEIRWEGTASGEDIEGTVQIIKKGRVKKEYSFTGTLKAKKKK